MAFPPQSLSPPLRLKDGGQARQTDRGQALNRIVHSSHYLSGGRGLRSGFRGDSPQYSC